MNPPLRKAMSDGLDALIGALELQELDTHRFRVAPNAIRIFERVYGGQLLAQALMAAGNTVSGKAPQSMHAAFVRAGTPGCSLELDVDRVRDGRSMSTREVTVREDGKPLLTAIVSFHNGSTDPEVAPSAPAVAPPGDIPLLQDWAARLPADEAEYGRHWIHQPPPIEMRIPEAPSFLGGSLSGSTRSHWMRVPRDVGDDQLVHAALLAYASDFLLMDMVFHAHPATGGLGRSNGLSLDHAIWFHRPARFDQWHLHTQQALAVVGDRGLAHGTIHDHDGRLVATVMQEILVFPGTAS